MSNTVIDSTKKYFCRTKLRRRPISSSSYLFCKNSIWHIIGFDVAFVNKLSYQKYIHTHLNKKKTWTSTFRGNTRVMDVRAPKQTRTYCECVCVHVCENRFIQIWTVNICWLNITALYMWKTGGDTEKLNKFAFRKK